MTKTETNESQGDFNSLGSEPHRTFTTNSPRKWKNFENKEDLVKPCFICDTALKVKYIAPKKQYSRKNNWGYWTGKAVFSNKYACNSCLVNIHKGGIINWVNGLEKADIFYTYLSRKNFNE